jgi:hypothetical protein
VCKYNYEKFGQKADLYIAETGDVFSTGLEKTYLDLKPVIESQDWINSFNVYDRQTIQVNLNSFRSSHLLFNSNWLNIYFNSFLPGEEIPLEYSWIDIPKIEKYKNALVVNRSPKRYGTQMSPDTLSKIKEIALDYKEKFFICSEPSQYEMFELKNEFECVIMPDLFSFFQAIKSCGLFFGNQSAPFAMASSMNVPRVLEILNPGHMPDGVHYASDCNYYRNFRIA